MVPIDTAIVDVPTRIRRDAGWKHHRPCRSSNDDCGDWPPRYWVTLIHLIRRRKLKIVRWRDAALPPCARVRDDIRQSFPVRPDRQTQERSRTRSIRGAETAPDR